MSLPVYKPFHLEETSSEKDIPQGFQAPSSVNWITAG
jgi:hypothetical protein